MFELASNIEIGKYLSVQIKNKGYCSTRQFCIEYLKADNKDYKNSYIINKMANRMSQMLNGNKGIQLSDLPIFSRLLDLSCEEILSAGKYFVPRSNRITNYSAAMSNDPTKWESLINHEDNLIMNSDEYGKNAIDYAIEHNNYQFLQYLINKNYIWFDCGDPDKYVINFGADTKIQRREIQNIDDYLINQLYEKDNLRIEIIKMAINNEDFDMLTKMRAREIPEYYYKVNMLADIFPEFKTKYDEELNSIISKSSNNIVEYFTDSFAVRDRIRYKDGSKRNYIFMYPYISQLVDMLIVNKSKYVEKVLRKCIKHNNEVYDKLKKYASDQISDCQYALYLSDKEYYVDLIFKSHYSYNSEANIINFNYSTDKDVIFFTTNIVACNKTSDSPDLKQLINQLKDSHSKIINLKDEMKGIQNVSNI